VREQEARWLWLSIPIAALGAVAAGGAIVFDSIYDRDTEHFGTQAVSQDWVTLLVAVPAILILGWYAARGSFPARLMWHGVAFYFAYTYTIAVFMLRFNAMFLIYTSLLACSIFAVAGGLSALNWASATRVRFGEEWPRRGTIVFLWFIVATFLFLWLSDIVPALLDGTLPESLSESETPTNGVQVLDLALMLPTAGLTAVWLRQGDSKGYVFATGLITYVCLLGLALAAMVVGLTVADLSSDIAVAVAFATVTVISAVLLSRMLRAMKGAHR